MKNKKLQAAFNPEWVKSVTKDQFIKAQSHLADAKELGDIYDKLTKKKEVAS